MRFGRRMSLLLYRVARLTLYTAWFAIVVSSLIGLGVYRTPTKGDLVADTLLHFGVLVAVLIGPFVEAKPFRALVVWSLNSLVLLSFVLTFIVPLRGQIALKLTLGLVALLAFVAFIQLTTSGSAESAQQRLPSGPVGPGGG